MKYVIILGDGMADFPNENLGNKTPLECAEKLTIDMIAQKSVAGMVKTVPDGMKPGSDVANLSVMGYEPDKYYTGRSPLEAVSAGVPLEDTDIAFRVNLVTLTDEECYEDKTMVDYSSDEISTEEATVLINDLAKELNTDTLKLYPGFSYRHILVWKNGKLTFNLTPPHDISDKPVKGHLPEGENSDVLYGLMKKSVEILKNHPVNLKRIERGLRPATSMWIWGEGSKTVLPSFESLYNVKGAVVSAVDLIKGIGKSADLEVAEVEGATGNIHTNFEGKAQASLELLKENDFLYVHLEAPDECGHRGEIENKVKSIEIIDKKIVKPIYDYLVNSGEDFKIAILPDHPTPLSIKTHVSDPVPFIIYDSRQEEKGIDTYTEAKCRETGIYLEKGKEIVTKLFN